MTNQLGRRDMFTAPEYRIYHIETPIGTFGVCTRDRASARDALFFRLVRVERFDRETAGEYADIGPCEDMGPANYRYDGEMAMPGPLDESGTEFGEWTPGTVLAY
jgi:hypothetical protein